MVSARQGGAAGLGLVLACLGFSLSTGLALKEPCAGGGASWDDGRAYRRLCYSDIVALYENEHLRSGRLPFLDPCPRRTSACDEYPVLNMYTMRAAAEPVHSQRGFFHANAVILAGAAIVVAVMLHRLVGQRALYFALAPSLVLYGFINWDLVAVAAATLATTAVVRGRSRASGVLLGIGAAAKLYPALLVAPFALHRSRRAGWHEGVVLAASAAITWASVNLPFVVAAFDGWSVFWRFNASRPADFDSLWYVACHRLVPHQPPGMACPYDPAINLASLGALVAGTALVYWLCVRRDRDFARWTFAFPMLVLFLLTNKVYSPQYGLWLLPLFAFLGVRLRTYVLFQMAEVAVFVTRFSFLGTFKGVPGLGIAPFQVAVLARAALLVVFLVDYVRGLNWAVPPGDERSGDDALASPAPVPTRELVT